MEERLSKVLALAGVASRRESDQLVRDGRVTVNGAVIIEPGHRVDVTADHIKVDGKLLTSTASPVYLLLNKPRGVLSARTDPEGRPTVVSMLRGVRGRVMPVGRLDWDDEGALLLTSDSALAFSLNDPKSGIPQTYLIKVRGVPDDRVLEKMRTGVPLEGGRSLPLEVRRVSATSRNAWLQVTIREVRPHLLQYMLMKLRHPIMKVKRVSFGPLGIKGLAPGTFRKLTQEEVARLKAVAANPPGLPEPSVAMDESLEAAKPARPVPAVPGAAGKPARPARTSARTAPRTPPMQPRAPRVKGHERLDRAAVMRSRARGPSGRR